MSVQILGYPDCTPEGYKLLSIEPVGGFVRIRFSRSRPRPDSVLSVNETEYLTYFINDSGVRVVTLREVL